MPDMYLATPRPGLPLLSPTENNSMQNKVKEQPNDWFWWNQTGSDDITTGSDDNNNSSDDIRSDWFWWH